MECRIRSMPEPVAGASVRGMRCERSPGPPSIGENPLTSFSPASQLLGAILTLMLCRTDLNIAALIGIVLLIGIVNEMAALLGALPLALRTGVGSELRRPLGSRSLAG
jgi:hypothetical protein